MYIYIENKNYLWKGYSFESDFLSQEPFEFRPQFSSGKLSHGTDMEAIKS